MEKSFILFRRYALVLAFLAIVLAGVTSYAYGLRLTTNGIVRVGTLVVQDIPEGTRVYTDQSRLTLASNTSARVDLLPGQHMVIVDAPLMQPWNELVTVSSGGVTTVTPILVPKEITARILSGEERAQGADAILSYTLPTKASPLRLAGGCALVYVVGNRVVSDATTTPSCTPPSFLSCEATATSTPCPSTVVFPPNERLESVSGHPRRDDALVVAAGGQAYVVELDPREPQFFAPIMKGVRVRGAPWTDTSIVISDTKKVYELPL